MVIDKVFAKYFLLFTLIFTGVTLAKDVYVEGYTRSDGTAVKGHYRSAPNSTINDNFSTEGNINPYTGKKGWIPKKSIITSLPQQQTNSTNTHNYNNSTIDYPNESVSYSTKHDSFFSDISPIGLVFSILFALGLMMILIIEPYKHTVEFLNSPSEYHKKYGTEEVCWNFIRGVGILAFWIFLITVTIF